MKEKSKQNYREKFRAVHHWHCMHDMGWELAIPVVLTLVLSATTVSGFAEAANPFTEAARRKDSLRRLDQCFCEVNPRPKVHVLGLGTCTGVMYVSDE